MRPQWLFIAATVAPMPIVAQSQVSTGQLMPVPQQVEWNGSKLRLDSTFSLAIIDYRDGRLERAVDRAVRRLEARIGITLPRTAGADSSSTLVIAVAGPGFAIPDLDEDESYHLTVTSSQARLDAHTVVGALRGLETLQQLQSTDPGGYFLSGATISDAPRFKWRGLLVDVSRHWEPPAVIKRTLDGMAMVKLNVLHWHLSDDQGFRVESRLNPGLQGSGSDGNYYTHDQIREIVAYAADRGIRVVPEFDMPGHTSSWFVGYPFLASAGGPFEIKRTWGVHRPTMDPTRESTWKFLERFIAEMTALLPDRYWHVGGDEVDPTVWNASQHIQDWMRQHDIADAHELQTYFNERLFAILARHDRTPVGWDEILQPGLPEGAVIQSWRGLDGLRNATAEGRAALLSAPYYLDHIKTAAAMYLTDPVPDGISAEQAALVLGGEACMWAEYVTSETIDSRIWPRMAAIAERFWSDRSVRDVPDMYRRMAVVSRQLTEVGTRQFNHTRRMLTRLAPSDAIPELEAFLHYVRPRGFGGRGTNQFSPLTHLIDAAIPEPPTGARMRYLVATIDQPGQLEALEEHFRQMTSFRSRLEGLVPEAPVAGEGIPVATALAELGQTGIAAIEFSRRGTRPPDAWFTAADSLIARTDNEAFGLLRPVGAETLRHLIDRLR